MQPLYRYVCVLALLVGGLSPKLATAQMLVGQDTLYGNEWLRDGADYLKATLKEGGAYKVTGADLAAAGWSGVTGGEIGVVGYGRPVRSYVTTEGPWGPADYLLFYADEALALEFDRRVYEADASQMLNPDAQLAYDSLVFFLERGGAAPARYAEVDAAVAAGAPTSSVGVARGQNPEVVTYVKPSSSLREGAYFSSFRESEGWAYGNARAVISRIATPGAVRTEPATCTLRALSSLTTGTRQLEIAVDGKLLDTITGVPNRMYETQIAVDGLSLADGLANLRVRGLGGSDRWALGLIDLRYARELDLGDVPAIRFAPTGTGVDAHEFAGLSPGASELFVLDLEGGRAHRPTDARSALLPAGAAGELVAVDAARAAAPTLAAMRRPGALSAASAADYLIVTTEAFAAYATNAAAWAAFRAGAAGGGHATAVVLVEELYDAFGYGVPQHPLALRNALHYLDRDGGLDNVLLLGKGRTFGRTRSEASRLDALNATAYVPTFGSPGADNLLAWNPLRSQLSFAIGRVAAADETDIRVALEKTVESEAARRGPQTIADQLWMKRIIHLGGGNNPGEQQLIRNYLERAAGVIEASDRGMSVSAVYKDASVPVQQGETEALFEQINAGAAILTFFGHSSTGTLDFNINDPSSYKNFGRYPALLSLGCYSGDIHAPGRSVGERFMFLDNRATVGFAASSGLGYPDRLLAFALRVYERLGEADDEVTFGEALRGSLQTSLRSLDALTIQLGEQYNYQGDPALTLYAAPGPDYLVDADAVELEAADLTPRADSIAYAFDVVNLGNRSPDSLVVLVDRDAPGRTRERVDSVALGSVGYRTRVSRRIAGWRGEGVGLNRLYFTVQTAADEAPAPGAIANNVARAVPFFVRDNGVTAVYPAPGAALAGDSVRLFVSTNDPFAEAAPIRFELSRSPTFAPLAREAEIDGVGLTEWRPGVLAEGAYYWRARFAGDTAALGWTDGAFTVRPGLTASGVAGVYTPEQFAAAPQDSRDYLAIDSSGRWQFDPDGFFATLRNKQNDATGAPAWIFDFQNPAISIRPHIYLDAGMAVTWIRYRERGAERNSDPASIGAVPSGNSRTFPFEMETAQQRQNLADYLNAIPDSSWVWLWSIYKPNDTLDLAAWASDSLAGGALSFPATVRQTGAQLFDAWLAGPTAPYSLVYQQGFGRVLAEALGTDRDDVLTTDAFVPIPGEFGRYVSEALPPARELYSLRVLPEGPLRTGLQQEIALLAVADGDTVRYALDTLGGGEFDLGDIDAGGVERFHVEVTQRDPVAKVPRPIERIELRYRPLPDLRYEPLHFRRVGADTVSAGEDYALALAVRNASPTGLRTGPIATLDELRPDGTGVQRFDTLSVLGGWGVDTASFTFDTRDWRAGRDYLMTAAAREPLAGPPAVGYRSVAVRDDGLAPEIRIFIDGERAGVQAALTTRPTFAIEFYDDNTFLTLDRERLTVSLVYPDGSVRDDDDLPGELTFVDQTQRGQLAVAEFAYEPGALGDGVYTLRVGGRDASGNASPTVASARFEIANATAVSSVVPFPNPFVDATRFHYEATGQVPNDYQIDIYTSSGRLVRSLGPDDLGALTVGRNLTRGTWDGTDAYGQELARGVYLYRFSVSEVAGAAPEHRDTAIDDFVESGFGKLVKLR